MPAAWVRHWVEKKMTSWSSEGRAVMERRWRSCSGVARGLVMWAAILAVVCWRLELGCDVLKRASDPCWCSGCKCRDGAQSGMEKPWRSTYFQPRCEDDADLFLRSNTTDILSEAYLGSVSISGNWVVLWLWLATRRLVHKNSSSGYTMLCPAS